MEPTMDHSATNAPAAEVGADLVFFDNHHNKLVRLLAKNFLLNIITLGVYRFWARTNLRRYFWYGIEIGGDRLEYTGRGIELFVGFLIVVAVLLLIGIPLTLAQFFLLGEDSILGLIADFSYYIILFVLIQIAIFRARRYRVARTFWRGIRFTLEGTSFRYATISCLHGLFVLLTLGLAVPWRNVALYRYLTNGMRFGNQHFSFIGNGRELVGKWLPVICFGYFILALLISLNWNLITYFVNLVMSSLGLERNLAEELEQHFNPHGWWPLLLIPFSLILQFWYGILQFKYFINRTTLGSTSVETSLRARQVIRYVSIYYVVVLIGWAVILGISFNLLVSIGSDGARGTFLGSFFSIGLLFIVFLLLNILRVAWLHYVLLEIFCSSISIRNYTAVDNVVRGADDSMKFGEGLADVMDYGEF